MKFRKIITCIFFRHPSANALQIFSWLLYFSITSPVLAQVDPSAILQHYIQIKSVSGQEKKAGEYIEAVCRKFGLYTKQFSDSDSSYNFCASVFPIQKNKKSVILINHLDVVAAEDEANWTYPPFEGKIAQDSIYGRGAIDMKGLAVMQIFALKKIKESLVEDSCKFNLCVLFLSGEESGGKNGAALMIQPALLQQLNPLVVFGEGGGGLTNVIPGKKEELCFFVSNAEKKSLWLKLEVKAKSHGHGSVPSSKTADKILLKALNKIENTEERIFIDKSTKKTFHEIGSIMAGTKGFILKHVNWWIFKPLRHKIFDQNEALKTLVTNSYQLTRIHNPQGSVNQVAQVATAYYDCRLLPHKSEKPLVLKLVFGILDPRLKITIMDESPECDYTTLDVHYENMSKAILSVFPKSHVIPILFPATTDNSYFRSMGIPAYGLLPFKLNESMIESVHAMNEKIPLTALDDGIRIYSTFLKNYLH